jgi:aminoglycoside phosphotransferase (APT) family kinase protein
LAAPIDHRKPVSSRLPAEHDRAATPDELRAWVESVTGRSVTGWHQITGGNRCHSWAVDVAPGVGAPSALYLRYQPPRPPSAEPYTVWREADVYRVLQGSDVPAPKLIAVNPKYQALLTERVPGRADFRRLVNDAEREAVTKDFIQGLARLHKLPISQTASQALAPDATIAESVKRELDIWRAMYSETGRIDPLIELALEWLEGHVPNPPGSPVLVHGDAGPGNFLFENGQLTGLIDWELAHPGDPMEDLAWLSMRAVMEPVPDFAERVREYGRLMGAPADLDRIRYHRVFVSTRVVIIRHRNVTGQPGSSIISRALNRRLLVAALAEAMDLNLLVTDRIDAEPTKQTILYDAVIRDLRDEVVAIIKEPRVIAAAKDAARVVKYLREVDRLGGLIEARDLSCLSELLGRRPAGVEEGQLDLLKAMRGGSIPIGSVIQYFAGTTARDAELAAYASGSMADRNFPDLEPDRATNE